MAFLLPILLYYGNRTSTELKKRDFLRKPRIGSFPLSFGLRLLQLLNFYHLSENSALRLYFAAIW